MVAETCRRLVSNVTYTTMIWTKGTSREEVPTTLRVVSQLLAG